MCVPPSWLVATPWLVPILLRPLVKVRGSSPRRGSSPLLIVPTPKGWKAEYTLASRMQIHESLTVLALLTRGEARTSDPWICSLMLYHLSYLTTVTSHVQHLANHLLIYSDDLLSIALLFFQNYFLQHHRSPRMDSCEKLVIVLLKFLHLMLF